MLLLLLVLPLTVCSIVVALFAAILIFVEQWLGRFVTWNPIPIPSIDDNFWSIIQLCCSTWRLMSSILFFLCFCCSSNCNRFCKPDRIFSFQWVGGSISVWVVAVGGRILVLAVSYIFQTVFRPSLFRLSFSNSLDGDNGGEDVVVVNRLTSYC